MRFFPLHLTVRGACGRAVVEEQCEWQRVPIISLGRVVTQAWNIAHDVQETDCQYEEARHEESDEDLFPSVSQGHP